MKTLKPYPSWVCIDCAINALTEDELKRLNGHLSTFHKDICGVCGKEKAVTEPRDYGYPIFEGHERP